MPYPLERAIWPLGSLYYCGSIADGLDGPPAAMCEHLLDMVWGRLDAKPPRCKVPVHELKILSLDLMAYFSEKQLAMPEELVFAVGRLMDLSDDELRDPHSFLDDRNKAGRPSNAQARDIAFHLDAQYWRDHKELMPPHQLWTQVAKVLGVPREESVSRATVEAWRRDYVYILHMAPLPKYDGSILPE